MTIEDKIAKLPVWAQNRIENLERKLREINALYVSVRDRNFQGSGRVQINCLLEPERAINLHDHEIVRFKIGDRYDHYVECYFPYDLNDLNNGTVVEIRGGIPIEVLPHSSNKISVRVRND